MTTILPTDLSFTIRYLDGAWLARCRELPAVSVSAGAPHQALEALVAQLAPALAELDAATVARIKGNDPQVEAQGRRLFHQHHHIQHDYQPTAWTSVILDEGSDEETLVGVPVVLRGTLDHEDPYLRDSGYFIDGYKRGVAAR